MTRLQDNLCCRTKTGTLVCSARQFVSRIDDDDPEEFICKYEVFFNRPDIDNWEIRKAMEDLQGTLLIYKCFYVFFFIIELGKKMYTIK